MTETWWKIVVDAKFGSAWGGWCSIDLPGAHGVGLWKNIRVGGGCSHTRFELGNESKIKFWDDVWCGEMTLKEAFSDLYDIILVKSVAVNLDFSSRSIWWNVSFIRAAHDWEVDALASFYTLLYSSRVRREGEDKLSWALSHKGKFDVGSFYKNPCL
jgi:hypothetical protein